MGGVNEEEAASLVVRHFERLKGQWHGVLQDIVYERHVQNRTCAWIYACDFILSYFTLYEIIYQLNESIYQI